MEEKYDKLRERRNRLMAFSLITVALFSVLSLRLWYMQVLASEDYKNLAERNRSRVVEEMTPRGEIFDRNGLKLVGNENLWVVEMLPEGGMRELRKLSKFSGEDLTLLAKRWKKMKTKLGPLMPVPVMEGVSYELAVKLKERAWQFPRLQVRNSYRRIYLRERTASHLLGYLGEPTEKQMKEEKGMIPGDKVGKAGVEFSYDQVLRGAKSRKIIEVDAMGKSVRTLKKEKGQAGKNLVLTLDANIQNAAEKALSDWVRKAKKTKEGARASAGAAVVLDPRNGDVLALASYPDYRPSIFSGRIEEKAWAELNSKKSRYPLNNRAIMSGYAPASTFKPFVLVAGLEDGMTSLQSSYRCSGKWIGMGRKWPKMCWLRRGHGVSGLVRALEVSCDTVFYEIGYRFYKNKSNMEGIQNWSRKFGYGKVTGIDLPFEFKGRVPDAAWKRKFNAKFSEVYKMWMPGDTVNLSIGQGDFLSTPLQVAASYGALANGGTLIKPHVAKRIIAFDGRTSWDIPVEEVRTVKSPDAYRVIHKGMKKVVATGTAKDTFSGFPVEIAGKTGTGQVRGRGDTAWFASYAPAEKPEYVVVVMIEEGGSGGKIAGGAVRDIYESIYSFKSTKQ